MTERTVTHDAWIVYCSECEDAIHECGQSRRLVSVPWCIVHEYPQCSSPGCPFPEETHCVRGSGDFCDVRDGVVWKVVTE